MGSVLMKPPSRPQVCSMTTLEVSPTTGSVHYPKNVVPTCSSLSLSSHEPSSSPSSAFVQPSTLKSTTCVSWITRPLVRCHLWCGQKGEELGEAPHLQGAWRVRLTPQTASAPLLAGEQPAAPLARCTWSILPRGFIYPPAILGLEKLTSIKKIKF